MVFGLVGPIGVDMSAIDHTLASALSSVGYSTHSIRVTELMTQIDVDVEMITDSADPLKHYESRIDYANAVRARCQSDAALAALAIHAIRSTRVAANGVASGTINDLADLPLEKHAYILRQFKRREEIELLRKVYGRKFVQVSVNVDADERAKSLALKMAVQNPNLDQRACEDFASKLIERDLDERAVEHGQRIGDVFHLGDVFVDARTDATTEATIRRFIEAFFGKNSLSPSPDEYGTYMAASAALRSLDTSRQVGAAIFTQHSEVIALGSNEVPKAGGGTYWGNDIHPHRDFDEGHDANTTNKQRLLFDLVRRLRLGNFISTEKTDVELFSEVAASPSVEEALVLDITEFGRMTHAEMNAITDAARLGRPTKGGILYCTTFPCHNCAKHIVAAGIDRVVYIEPYPKSRALDLHYDSITTNPDDGKRVLFEHFHGISPRRYRDIFEKQKRRNADGTLAEWYEGQPAPRVEDRSPFYVYNEASAILSGLNEVAVELGIISEIFADPPDELTQE